MSIVLAVFTVVASGVLATIIAYQLNATKEHVFFMRKKVEALYLAIERYDRSLSVHFLSYYSLLKNEISYNDLLDLQIKRDSNSIGSGEALETATMLINVYFSDLKFHLDRYMTVCEGINKIIANHKRAYKGGDSDGTPWLKQFDEAIQELDRTSDAFKQAVIAEAVALAPAGRFWPQALRFSVLGAKRDRILRRNKTLG